MRVELLHGAHQAKIAFLHEIEHRQSAVLVLARDADHQPQVGVRQVFTRVPADILDGLPPVFNIADNVVRKFADRLGVQHGNHIERQQPPQLGNRGDRRHGVVLLDIEHLRHLRLRAGVHRQVESVADFVDCERVANRGIRGQLEAENGGKLQQRRAALSQRHIDVEYELCR